MKKPSPMFSECAEEESWKILRGNRISEEVGNYEQGQMVVQDDVDVFFGEGSANGSFGGRINTTYIQDYFKS